jgi:peptide/histidine transporter 3/4
MTRVVILLLHIVNEVAERLAFFAIAVNMVAYLVFEMHQSLPAAATHVTDWIGTAYVLTILGAFLADAYFGRFKTIIIFSCVYAVVINYKALKPSVSVLENLHQLLCILANQKVLLIFYFT